MPWRRVGGEEIETLPILELGTKSFWPRFGPGERTPDTHYTGGWVRPRAGPDAGAGGNILCGESKPSHAVRSQTLY
jgi:hypothetical protein